VNTAASRKAAGFCMARPLLFGPTQLRIEGVDPRRILQQCAPQVENFGMRLPKTGRPLRRRAAAGNLIPRA
jgi:hypothetical protein